MKGPAFVPSGIHKAAYLVTLSNATDKTSFESSQVPLRIASPGSPIFIEETSIDIYKLGQSFSVAPEQAADWVVNVSLSLRTATTYFDPSVKLSIPELGLASDIIDLPPISDSMWVYINWTIPDGIPQRWYPHNLGTPKLYNLTVTLNLAPHSISVPPVSFTTQTGFRTIQLVQTPYTQTEIDERGITPGDNWHFEINGKAFFSKGANLIPFDPFYSRVETDKVRWVLESAVQSGLNMVSCHYFYIY